MARRKELPKNNNIKIQHNITKLNKRKQTKNNNFF